MAVTQVAIKGSAAPGQAMRLWRNLKARFLPAPIATIDAFKVFLEERAALVAQKCAIDYVRGKTGLASYALFTEDPFLKALDICRWETFVAVLGDLLIVAEGNLRPHAESEQRTKLLEALQGLHSAILTAMPAPIHRTQGWDEAIASFAERLKTVSLAEPQSALDVADHSAKRLFDTLPIHLSMRALDEEVVYGAVRFRLIAVSQEMRRRIAADDLAGQLLAAS